MATGFLHPSRRVSLTTRISACGLLAVFLLVVSGPAAALDPSLRPSQYILDQWQTREGLPQNGAATIIRAPDGYLWIGTQEGLARFDGVRFVVFDRNNEPALPSNVILVLFVDHAGRFWVGTEEGMAVFENGHIKPYTAVAALAHSSINAILEDKKARIRHRRRPSRRQHSSAPRRPQWDDLGGDRDGGIAPLRWYSLRIDATRPG
jgi:hypothetical protein